MKIFFTCFLIFFLPHIVHSQVHSFGSDTASPITYFVRGTSKMSPEELTVAGEIVDATSGPSCGILEGSGTMKIKVLKSSKPYPARYVFLVVPCFSGCDSCVGTIVNLRVSALYKRSKNKSKSYPYEFIENKFASHAVPFYWLKDKNKNSHYNW